MGVGRPSKLTSDRQKRLLDAIRAGAFYEPACAYAGISYQTCRNWMARGKEDGAGEYFEFLESVKAVEAELELELAGAWSEAAKTDWRASMEFLSRRFPDRWSPTRKTEISGSETEPCTVDLNLILARHGGAEGSDCRRGASIWSREHQCWRQGSAWRD